MSFILEAKSLGKRYNREWIVKGFDYTFTSGQSYAVTGHNGQGKSTLLKLLLGYTPASEGQLKLIEAETATAVEEFYQSTNICAPYLQLIEEFTIKELLNFHTKFKPLNVGLTYSDFVELVYLKEHQQKPIKFFSSGMKQRLKIGLALFTDCKLLFLDEPTNNLDLTGKKWYLDHMSNMDLSEKIVIIASNDKSEYGFCDHVLVNYLFNKL